MEKEEEELPGQTRARDIGAIESGQANSELKCAMLQRPNENNWPESPKK